MGLWRLVASVGMKNIDVVVITAIAVVGIVVLEVCAIMNHIDGVALAGAIAAVAGISGYQIKKVRG